MAFAPRCISRGGPDRLLHDGHHQTRPPGETGSSRRATGCSATGQVGARSAAPRAPFSERPTGTPDTWEFTPNETGPRRQRRTLLRWTGHNMERPSVCGDSAAVFWSTLPWGELQFAQRGFGGRQPRSTSYEHRQQHGHGRTSMHCRQACAPLSSLPAPAPRAAAFDRGGQECSHDGGFRFKRQTG